MSRTVFNTNPTNLLEQPIFFGEDPNIARYDIQKYPPFEKQTDTQHGFFWRPEEINITKDKSDYKMLSDHEKHIFISNLSFQIAMDSVQGRSPSLALLPFVSIPELETCIAAWTFFETIHSRSYTHIIRNLIPNPDEVFSKIMLSKEILARAGELTKYYDEFIEYGNYYTLFGEGSHTISTDDKKSKTVTVTMRNLKKKLLKMLFSINILEGVRFYSSFASSWSFAENKKMEGNAQIIKLICRDENIHLGIVQNIIKFLFKEDPIYLEIFKEIEEEVYEMFKIAVDQEKEWAKYLFQYGSILGLNEALLSSFVEFIANKRLKALGLKMIFETIKNPLPWTDHWITSDKVQVAPQETNITTYIVGGLTMDIDEDSFKGFSL